MRLAVPNTATSRDVLEFGRRLQELEEAELYEFDFGEVTFVTPGWLIVVGDAFRRFRMNRPHRKRRALNYKHLGYAAHVGFFKYFGMTFGLAPSEAPGSDTYVPLTEINVGNIQKIAAQQFLPVGEVAETEARTLAQLLTRHDHGEVFDILTYSIREIVRNVIEHSSAESYTMAAQYWPNKGLAEFAVSDNGCGVLSSLKENPQLHVCNEAEALKLAVLPGISSKAWRRARRNDVWANSGYGLFMIQRLCSLAGEFTILTGSAGMHVSASHTSEFCTFAPGTTVVMRMNTEAIKDLNARLADFRKEGRELATRLKGASLSGPSPASHHLRPTRD
ncbi:MAG: hypothetical protein IT537_05480 [Hyphomicrobiales bacterium]|nr:hypothetical protein [Hyphomicrobiales bacterium]